MRRFCFLFVLLAMAAGLRAGTPVEAFCAQFASGCEIRVYRGFPERGYDKSLYVAAEKAGCISLLGQVFYPELKTLAPKEGAEWLAQATNAASYYPAPDTEQKSHADLGFWCVTADHKNEAYCLVSLAASQAHFWVAGKEVTVAITLDFENLCRGVLKRTFEQEASGEKSNSAEGLK